MSDHRSFPKQAPRITDRLAQQQQRAREWAACCHAVDVRDHYRCRVCGCRTVKSLSRCANRAEHHHLVPRSLLSALIADPRACILVCARCHVRLTHHRLKPHGETFIVNGRVCISANAPITFVVC